MSNSLLVHGTYLKLVDTRLFLNGRMHFFTRVAFAKIVEPLDRSERTVLRDWLAARALLRLDLEMRQ